MKKVLLVTLIFSLMLSVTACSQSVSQEEYDKIVSENEKIKEEYKKLAAEKEKTVEERDSLTGELNSAKQKIASLDDELTQVKSELDKYKKAEEESNSPELRSFTFGEELTITVDDSKFKITIDDVKKRDSWDGDSEKSDINILCIIENENYQSWDQVLHPYTLLSDGIMQVEDENGFNLQFVDVSPYQDGMYSVTEVPFNTKAKICIPVEAEKSCSKVTIKIGNYTTEISFDN